MSFRFRAGWTLVEMIVSLAILSIVFALILAGIQRVRSSAATLSCKNQLRQLAVATQSFSSTHHRLPTALYFPSSPKFDESTISKHLGYSIHSQLLPFLEHAELFRRIDEAHRLDPFGSDITHEPVSLVSVPTFRCPSDPRRVGGQVDYSGMHEVVQKVYPPTALNNYLFCYGTRVRMPNGVFVFGRYTTLTDIRDGTSQTIIAGERPTPPYGFGAGWYHLWGDSIWIEAQMMIVSKSHANTSLPGDGCSSSPRTQFMFGRYDSRCHNRHYWSLHPGGANFAFADGSVHFLSYGAGSILPALATRAGGETVQLPD